MFGELFEVAMSKNCTRLWRKARFEVKMSKHVSSGQFLEVMMSKNCMNLWREAHWSVKIYKIPVFWRAFSSSDVEPVVR